MRSCFFRECRDIASSTVNLAHANFHEDASGDCCHAHTAAGSSIDLLSVLVYKFPWPAGAAGVTALHRRMLLVLFFCRCSVSQSVDYIFSNFLLIIFYCHQVTSILQAAGAGGI